MSIFRCAASAALSLTVLVACSGGSTGGKDTSTAGIALPSEISALPATSAPTAAVRASRLAAVRAAAVAPDSDYATAQTIRAVDERALAQFDILNVIFGAVAQTHYAEAANVGAGPYGAIVSWIDGGDRPEKQLVRWVVDSRMATVDGQDVNRIRVWFFQPDQGAMRVIQVAMDVFQAPTRNADGTYADYGVWTIDARLADDGSQFFVASADHDAGMSRVTVHQADKGGALTRGILLRAADHGYGKVTYPDWSSCNSDSCVPEEVTVAYVYDAQHVALQKGGATLFKSRTDTVDVVQRYGLFDASTGADVARGHSFGFPIRFTAGGVEQYGYYGAWQGRHQIWSNGNGVAPGLTVYRGDRVGSTASYTTSALFPGVLTRRVYLPSSTDELGGQVLNTWIGQGARAVFDGSAWTACVDPQWSGGPQPTCASEGVVDGSFFQAQSPESVMISRWDQQTSSSMMLVYQSGQFWVATQGSNGPVATATEWVPQAGDEIWVNRNGPVWVVFDGTSWWQKSVASYDPSTNTPTFGDADAPFTFVPGRDYYLNANGVSYVLRQTDAGTDVRIERQIVPNPADAAELIASGLRFRRSWGGDTASTFRFGTTPGQAGFMELTYDVVGSQDEASGKVPGQVVEEGIWSMAAELDGAPTGDAYSWDYPTDGQSWAVQQYLLDGSSYLVLDDPIRCAPISLTSHGGQARSYALQYDGSWVGGLPDPRKQLQAAGWDMTADVAAQVVNIPEGQEVVDALDASLHYLFKPLQISQLLLPIDDPGNLDLAPALGLDLSTVPAFTDPALGAPPDVPIRYSEGEPVP